MALIHYKETYKTAVMVPHVTDIHIISVSLHDLDKYIGRDSNDRERKISNKRSALSGTPTVGFPGGTLPQTR